MRIGFMKKSHIEGAKGIEQAVRNCGTDKDCLSKVYERYKHLLEGDSGSFPIQMTIQCIPQCRGTEEVTKRKESTDCKGRTKSDDDSSTVPIFCLPMAFEIKDGKVKFVVADNGLEHCRIFTEGRFNHLQEIMETHKHAFQNIETIKSMNEKYKKYKLPGI